MDAFHDWQVRRSTGFPALLSQLALGAASFSFVAYSSLLDCWLGGLAVDSLPAWRRGNLQLVLDNCIRAMTLPAMGSVSFL